MMDAGGVVPVPVPVPTPTRRRRPRRRPTRNGGGGGKYDGGIIDPVPTPTPTRRRRPRRRGRGGGGKDDGGNPVSLSLIHDPNTTLLGTAVGAENERSPQEIYEDVLRNHLLNQKRVYGLRPTVGQEDTSISTSSRLRGRIELPFNNGCQLPLEMRGATRSGRGGGKDDGGNPSSLSLHDLNTTLLGTAVGAENERSPLEIYEAVLRNHLLNQKRLYGLRPTVRLEDNNISISISNRLRGRIELPFNSGCQFPLESGRATRSGRGGGKDHGGNPVSLSLHYPNKTLLGTSVGVENERSPQDIYEAVLRNHLLNQKRLYGLRPTVSLEDNNISISISNRLRGRIELPFNSGCQFPLESGRATRSGRGGGKDHGGNPVSLSLHYPNKTLLGTAVGVENERSPQDIYEAVLRNHLLNQKRLYGLRPTVSLEDNNISISNRLRGRIELPFNSGCQFPLESGRATRSGRGGGKDHGGNPVSLSLHYPNKTLLGTAVGVENERSPQDIYEAVLRNHLLNQKRLYGLRPTVSQEDNNINISSPLPGRIKLPVNSGCEFQSGREREAARGSVWDRLSPDIPKRGSLLDRIKWPVEAEDLGNKGSSVRGRPFIMRSLLDDAAFAGLESLVGLKSGKSSEKEDPSHSFEGPKPLSVILKRKREASGVTLSQPTDEEAQNNKRKRSLGCGSSGISAVARTSIAVCSPPAKEISSDHVHDDDKVVSLAETGNAVCPPPAKDIASNHAHNDKVDCTSPEGVPQKTLVDGEVMYLIRGMRTMSISARKEISRDHAGSDWVVPVGSSCGHGRECKLQEDILDNALVGQKMMIEGMGIWSISTVRSIMA